MSERGDDLTVLGLTAGEPATHDQVRRAYLRRLRSHPPERDPEGFRRLREAFERLEPWARLQDLLRAAIAEREAASRAGGKDAGAAELEDARGVEHERAGDLERGTAADVTRGDARDSERTATEWAGWPERREAPAEAPGEPGEPVALPPPIVVKFDHRGRVIAQPPSPAEPTNAADHDEPESLSSVIEDLLELLDGGQLDAARALVEQWNRSALDDHREVSPVDAQRWALTRELVEVARRLPDSLRRAIVRGIRCDDLTAAYAAAESYQGRYPVEASELAQSLAKRAPNLHRSLGVLLVARPSTGQASGPSAGSVFRPIWIAAVLISAFYRGASGCDGHPPIPTAPRESVPWRPMPRESQQWRELPPSDPSRPEVHPQPERWFERQPDPPVDFYGHRPSPQRGTNPPGAVRPDGEAPPSQR